MTKVLTLIVAVTMIFGMILTSFATDTIASNDAEQGDLNGDYAVTAQDAVYLMYHTLNPEKYTLNQDADFDASGSVTIDDAVYLLYYVLFGAEEYPLPDLDDDGLNVTPR